jgi:hypothetical protein
MSTISYSISLYDRHGGFLKDVDDIATKEESIEIALKMVKEELEKENYSDRSGVQVVINRWID